MPTELIVRPRPIAKDLASYAVLKRKVKETFLAGRHKIQDIQIQTYWEAGRLIHEHVLHHQERADYGKEVILKLARGLNVGDDLLYRCRHVYETIPISATWRKLTWSHYRTLAQIPDPKKRREFADLANKNDWTVKELARKVRSQIRKSKNKKPAKPPEPLVPKKGKIGVFQIVEISGKLNWDKGFASYTELSDTGARRFKAGDLVRLKGKGTLEKDPKAKREDLFTYEADVLLVIDADTFWMRIWLAGPDWRKEKLRLRGLDAPELGTRQGDAAKRFVEKLFREAEKIVIATTKPDKWDRYLSDVFLTFPGGEEIYLNNLLLEKGLARRKSTFTFWDWEKS